MCVLGCVDGLARPVDFIIVWEVGPLFFLFLFKLPPPNNAGPLVIFSRS